MNMIFLTQSKTLSLFFDLMQIFKKKTEIEKVGFYVADSNFYHGFEKQHPEISSDSFELLKEWEIIGQSKETAVDIERLREFEEKLGDPVLWNAILSDRRIFLGEKAALEQDYPSRFGFERILAILQVGIEEMECFFDRVQPDAVVGFICVTIGDYLAYLVAKSRNIPFYNLRPMRVKNYFQAGESIFEPSKAVQDAYDEMRADGIEESLKQEAEAYLSEVREKHAMYEGVLPPSGSSFSGKVSKSAVIKKVTLVRKVSTILKQYYRYNLGKYRDDNHHIGIFYPIWLRKFKRPLRIWKTDFFLKRHYIDPSKLASMDYAFYPLHKEPEVSLLVFGRPYLNQIEVVRNLARSLPVGMKLLVKEHPAGIGYRPLSYYKKILSIPNVVLARPEMSSRHIVQNARLVAIVSGSIGLEALMMEKPVIYLGYVSFGFLPDSMIRGVYDLERLGWDICEILKSHKHDEDALIAFLAAVIKVSVPVDFYSRLIGRTSVLGAEDASSNETERVEHLERLADYLLERLPEPKKLIESD